jgi:hypothetical protein
MATISPRRLFRLLPVLLTALFAALPAAAEPSTYSDAPIAAADKSAQPPKQADHATRRLRHTASLEEFVELDDDAEQHFKPPPILVRPAIGSALVVKPLIVRYRQALRTHRACAGYPTGPPHA